MSDITTHADLLRALAEIRVEMEAQAEDLADLVSRVDLLADRTLAVADGLAELDVDQTTTDEIRDVAAALRGQQTAAHAYQQAADQAETQARQAAVTAHRKHGAIADAVASAPVAMADRRFYEDD
jgi:predicted  nucleic acid-binding Zn-ribbon protein